MAERFNHAGISARVVSGRSSTEERRSALQALSQGDLRILFSAELLNEGVDLPDVDTILFLRPTESATLFLQQLGRGLRHSEGKSCCTVLDFIGSAHRKFRFDQRFRRSSVVRAVTCSSRWNRGFPASERLQHRTGSRGTERRAGQHPTPTGDRPAGTDRDLKALGPTTTLDGFLAETGFDLEDVYERPGCCFADLRRKAGFSGRPLSPDRQRTERALARMLHIDDESRLGGFRAMLSDAAPPAADRLDPMQRMLFVLIGAMRDPLSAMASVWLQLWGENDLREELLTLLDVLRDRNRRLTAPLPVGLGALPFQVHATYSQDEVLAGFGELTSKDGIKRIQQGAYYFERYACDVFFVTLDKNEEDYTPTTLYQDYPLSTTVFHWESQSTCHEGTPTGRRYLEILPSSERHALLFVRQRRHDERGTTMPYLLLGPVFYRKHTGGRPMQIEWQLAHPMPARDFQEMKVAAG
jgi:hypothetical protein